MAAARIFRVIMPVWDLDPAVQFYQALLGDAGFRVSPGRHYFDCGGVILAVFSPKGDGDAVAPRPNFDYVYFAVADLDGVFERAQKTGGLSTRIGDGKLPMGQIGKRPWGERSFYMNDPFGNPLCFVDEKTLFTSHKGG